MAILQQIRLANGNLWVVWFDKRTQTLHEKEVTL